MKVPSPRKLPSGNWFIQLRIDGQSISITEADKDTCIAKAMAYKTGIIKAKKNPSALTLTQAIDRYIESRSRALSPSTIRGYRAIQRTRFTTIMNRPIASLTRPVIQTAVNRESTLCSAKTLTNAWRFLSSVIYEETSERFDIALPQIIPNERPYLTPEQIPVFLEAIKGNPLEIPALLALMSLRRSEIMGLKWKSIDLKNRLIYVDGASVIDEDGKLVNKPTNKNKSSRRVVPMTARLAELLSTTERTGDFVVNCNPHTIQRTVDRVCADNALPLVGVHGLRHSFASLAYHLGIPEKTVMKIGGWSNDATMRKIYTHISQSKINEDSAKLVDFLNNEMP